jgi:hypothetical protein
VLAAEGVQVFQGETLAETADIFAFGVVRTELSLFIFILSFYHVCVYLYIAVWELLTHSDPWHGKSLLEIWSTICTKKQRLPLPAALPTEARLRFSLSLSIAVACPLLL